MRERHQTDQTQVKLIGEPVYEYIISVWCTPGVQNVEFQFHMKVEMHRKIIPCHKQKCMPGSI